MFSALVLVLSEVAMAAPATAENWKGKLDPQKYQLGALAGLGIVNSDVGFSLLGTVARKILDEGFVPDISDTAWIEIAVGPIFMEGDTVFFYSTHLRWDFMKDEQWTFYSLVGLSGQIRDTPVGNDFMMFPRVAAGALLKINPTVALRGELSHELVNIGAVLSF